MKYKKIKQFNNPIIVQLAGCNVVPFGETKDIEKAGDYGWSPTYQDVWNLRLKYEKE